MKDIIYIYILFLLLLIGCYPKVEVSENLIHNSDLFKESFLEFSDKYSDLENVSLQFDRYVTITEDIISFSQEYMDSINNEGLNFDNTIKLLSNGLISRECSDPIVYHKNYIVYNALTELKQFSKIKHLVIFDPDGLGYYKKTSDDIRILYEFDIGDNWKYKIIKE